ncbi:MAG: PDZ domain-containing protein [Phycisphaerae bacterium]|nr:PDZ domain-containing protein [Phycisphaerae bacterium]
MALSYFALLLCSQTALGQSAPASPRWADILAPAAVTWPAPLPRVTWRTDLSAAIDEARRDSRPLFVTLRCLPCKQCADFDKDVLEGGPLLEPLLRQFVTVRLTDMRELDLRLLPVAQWQDLDLSWWGWFLDPAGRVYGVFGGRDEISDTTRISAAALAATLRRVLDHHYDPRRSQWNIDAAAPALGGRPRTPVDLPGYASWRRIKPAAAGADNCLHCHKVAEILRQPAIDAGRFDKRRDFDDWPFPENVGLTLERDDGLRVRTVRPESPAARAGLRRGDELAAAGGRRVFSQADFRAALHQSPRGDARIPIVWRRGADVMTAELVVAEGWRVGELGWRKSVAEAAIGAHMGFGWALAVPAAERRALVIADGAMAVRAFFGKKPMGGAAFAAGLRPHHVITAVNGRSPDLSDRPFKTWFRMNFEPGQEITLTVRERDGSPRSISYRAPGVE